MGLLGPEYRQIARTIPADHARTVSAAEMAQAALQRICAAAPDVLDLGCGD